MSMFRTLISTMSGGGGILPPAYQQVEYIRATGTQYINTGVYGTEDIDYTMEFAWNTIANSDQRYISGYDNYCPRVSASSSRLDRVQITQNGYSNYTISKLSADTKYKLEIRGNDIYIDDVLKTTRTRTQGTDIFPMIIFNQPYQYLYGSNMYLYSLKMYNSGTLIRDFVPCYRKSDTEIGLYDLVNDVFYTNDGTGTFIKGNDV